MMKTALGLLLGLIATVSWGCFYIAGRYLFGEDGEKLNPYLFNFLRLGIASCAFLPLLFRQKNRELVKEAFTKDLKVFLKIAFIGIVMENFLVFYALNFTTAARGSLMANFSPIATVILAYILLKVKTHKMGLLGMGIGFAGLVLAAIARGGDIYAETGLHSLQGDAMALASGFCWAYFTVAGAKVSGKYGGPICMFVCFVLGWAMMGVVNLFTTSIHDFELITPRICAGMIYTGMITLAMANACWYAALRYLDPVVLGAFGYLSATITFTLSALLLKEKFTLLFIVSIVLSLGGMALMMLRPRPRPHP